VGEGERDAAGAGETATMLGVSAAGRKASDEPMPSSSEHRSSGPATTMA
jgi:hypothetical protein